ncbi:MAG: diaminopimelate epimerase [Rhodothermales bacterium]
MTQRKLVVEFTKMHGAGNDFIIIDNRFYYFSLEEQSYLSQVLCERRMGIGADGLIVLGNATNVKADVDMRHYNPDGLAASLCGNGTRCAAVYALHASMATKSEVKIKSDVGVLNAVVKAQASESGHAAMVRMPSPTRYERLCIDSYEGVLHKVWTGTEHVVIEHAGNTDFLEVAPGIRHHPVFGKTGTNVNAIKIVGQNEARIRTYEKGVEAETLACGTGALAAAYVLMEQAELCQERQMITLHARGGTLNAHRIDEHWYLEGPVEFVYRGSFEYSGIT